MLPKNLLIVSFISECVPQPPWLGLLVRIGVLKVGKEQCMVEGERRSPSIALQAAPEEWGERSDAGAGGACVLPAGNPLHLCQL